MVKFLGAALAVLALAAPTLSVQSQEFSSEQLTAAQVELGFALLTGLAAAGTTSPNIVSSPASAAGALAVLDVGGSPEERLAIAKTLGFTPEQADAAIEALHAAALALAELVPGAGPMSYANAVFADADSPLAPTYIDELAKYGVGAYTAELGTTDGLALVNEWVSAQTAGLIPELLPAPMPTATRVILNALYFKDNWEFKFDPAATRPGPFKLADGTTAEVPLMHLEPTELSFREDDTFVAVTLPFANEQYSLSIVTTKGDPVAVTAFSPAASWLSGDGFGPCLCGVTFPKLTVESYASIWDILKTRGLGEEFGAMIDDVIQGAVLKIDETGAEAAAATAVIMPRALNVGPPHVAVLVDKPFLFSLRDASTGLVLLTGYIGKPELPKS